MAVLAVICFTYGYAYQNGIHDEQIVNKSKDDTRLPTNSITTWELFVATNNQRTKANVRPLQYSPYLEASAKEKCTDIISRNYWSHNAPDNTQPWVFIKKYWSDYKTAGENLAYGYATTDEVINGWMNSPVHKENVLNKSYTSVGFGVCESNDFIGQGHQTIIVQHFAS